MKNRTTPDSIKNLKPNEVFVFGSNLSGRHGKFSAKLAMKWGAKYGEASGLRGSTYAIPTKGLSVYISLPIEQIKDYVDEFIEFAKTRVDKVFLVTQIGCGSAGYTPESIAPLFKAAKDLENIHLPEKFWKVIEELKY